MGVTKTECFTTTQNELAILAKAIAHPARIAIIEFLLKSESCICSTIVEALPLAQPTVSQHLKELKNAGLIKGNIEGTAICYCLDLKGFNKLHAFFQSLKEPLAKNECC